MSAEKMNLITAIKHCLDVSARCRGSQCSVEHRKLAEWLEDYLKIKEWHYPAKGELPPFGKFGKDMSDKCVVAVKDLTKYITTAFYDFNEKGWITFPPGSWLNVYAWKIIEPPEEEDYELSNQ